jgi:hypothetical protein
MLKIFWKIAKQLIKNIAVNCLEVAIIITIGLTQTAKF